ncbi:S-layer homology domain-containing protein, partial [Nakamurella silvestris]
YTEIEWLAHQGLANGTAQPTGKPLFKPGTTIDRQSLAAILYR